MYLTKYNSNYKFTLSGLEDERENEKTLFNITGVCSARFWHRFKGRRSNIY
jgi:hypothetical protein